MQPITLETTSIVALVIIVVTLVYSFFKYKAEEKKEIILKEQKMIISKSRGNQHELAAITAIIAVLMEKKAFKIKNIVVGKGEEISTWRLFGRQEIMRGRANMQR